MTHVDPNLSADANLPSDFGDFAALLEEYEATHSPQEGEIVSGRIIELTKDYVTIDIGYKSEGQVAIDEFMGPDGNLTVAKGDAVDVYLEEAENEHGQVVLSKEKADKLKIWDEINGAVERDELVNGTITGRVKGGLTVDIGVKAFLPGSQIDLRPVRNLEKYLGETHEFKVIKFNKKRGNIVLSRRALLEKERAEMKNKTLDQLEVGLVTSGIVKNITDYGCFVDLGGIDGLLHITDMSWGRINHPSELFEVGDETQVMVLKFDAGTERVSLGLKQISEDPWAQITENYRIGERVKGKVVSLTDYGAFIELEDGIEGLIHVSEMSWTKRIKHPSQLVNVGDIVETVILDIDIEAKRISLGMKQIDANPWELLQERYPVGSVVRGSIRNITNFGVFIGIEEGIDGLIHVSDLTWSSKLKNPADAFEKGQELEAVVLNIDAEKERFSLGVKQLTMDPWDNVESRYPVGSVVETKITKTLDFGAIVAIDDDIEGLIHISELSWDKVDAVSDVVKEGDTVRAKVINLIPHERKIGLSLKQISEEEASDEYSQYIKQQRAEQSTTLGDLIGSKLSSLAPAPADEGGEVTAAVELPEPVEVEADEPAEAVAEEAIESTEA